jgi:hypothetical protein
MATQIQEINALVVKFIIDVFTDGLEKAAPLWKHMANEGKKRQIGGTQIQFPAKLLKNQSQGFISGTGATVSATPSVQLQYGTLPWKYYNYNVNFTIKDYNEAYGSALAVRDFFADKIEGAAEDAFRDLAAACWGSGNENPLAFNGLKDILADSGTSYAGLLNTDYEAGVYEPVDTSDAVNGTTVNYTAINRMITLVQARMQAGAKVNKKMMGLCNEAVFEKFKSSVQAQQRFVNEDDVAKTGFKGFLVNGVEFYLDAFAFGSRDNSTKDNWAVILPVDVIKFYYNYGFDNPSPFDTSKDGLQLPLQPIKSIQKYITGNIVCTNRRLVAVNKTLVA